MRFVLPLDSKLVLIWDVKDINVAPLLPSLIKKYGVADRVIVSAVDPATNAAVSRVLPPEVPLLPDLLSVLLRIVAYCFFVDWLIPYKHPMMGCVAVDFTRNILTEGMVKHWRDEGRPVFLFGPLLNEIESTRLYLSWGVDLCLTDRPDMLRALIDGTLGATEISVPKGLPYEGKTLYFAGGPEPGKK